MKAWQRLVALGAWSLATPLAAEPLERFNDRLFLPVILNGQTVTALLDSGAEMTIVDDDLAERLSLAIAGSAVARGSGAATMEARFVDRVSLRAAGVALDQRVAVLDLDEVSQRLIGRPVAMILGRELFDMVRLTIDIEGGTIVTRADDASPPGIWLDLGEHRGTPTIDVVVEGEPVEAAFDLGNGSEVLVGRSFAERTGLTAPERLVERRSGGGLGGATMRDIVMLRTLVVAGREFRDVPAAIDDGESASDLNLGTRILRHFLITTDFPRNSLWLEPRQ